MSPDDFAQFLKRLSPDADEAERRYVSLQKKLIGFLGMRDVSDPARNAAETLDRAAVRISRGANVPDVLKYCLGIARNVASESWCRERREETVFRRFIDGLADGSAEEVERIFSPGTRPLVVGAKNALHAAEVRDLKVEAHSLYLEVTPQPIGKGSGV